MPVLDETVLVACFVALAALITGFLLARWWRGVASRGRNRVAQSGEGLAEGLLEAEGYRIEQRQVVRAWEINVDGEDVRVDLRVDLLVSRDGRVYVAEVKTGALAPDPLHPPTRRQLLEYALAFGADEVLLVDVPARSIRTVAFPHVRFDG